MKKQILTILLCLLTCSAFCQQKGHFLLGGGPSWIIGNGEYSNPTTLLYSLEAGISYDVTGAIRLTGSLGGFRNVMSIYSTGWRKETANGPLVKIGADFLMGPSGKILRPSASIGAGYRLSVPKDAGNRSEGALLWAGLGTDIKIWGLGINISISGELTQSLKGAVGVTLRGTLPY